MKFARYFPLFFLLGGSLLRANPLTDTGTTATGSVLTSGSLDPTWVVTGPANGSAIEATVGNLAGGSWVGNDGTSQWIYDGTGSEDVGYFDYSTTFTVGNAATASFTGEYAVDNALVNVFLNGVALNISNSAGLPDGSANGFSAFTAFNIPVGADFNSGTNTLMFETYNGGGPAGVRVELTAVPDTGATVSLFGLALVGLLALRRKFAV